MRVEFFGKACRTCVQRLDADQRLSLRIQKIKPVAVTRCSNGGDVTRINSGAFDTSGNGDLRILPEFRHGALDHARPRLVRRSVHCVPGQLPASGVEQHGLHDRVARVQSEKERASLTHGYRYPTPLRRPPHHGR